MASLATLSCPSCTHRFKATIQSGRECLCPSCKQRLVVDGTQLKAVTATKPSPGMVVPRPTVPPTLPEPTVERPKSQGVPPPLTVGPATPQRSLQPIWMWLAGAGVLAAVGVVCLLPQSRRRVDATESPSLHRPVAIVRSSESVPRKVDVEAPITAKESSHVPVSDTNHAVTSNEIRSEKDPIQASLASVGLVRASNSSGSGFIAAPKLLVTNYHVIGGVLVSELRVRFPDNQAVAGRDYPLSLVVEDPRNDLAVLSVECDVPPLRVANPYTHTNGQKVVSIGSPGTGPGPGSFVLPNLTTDGRLGPEFIGRNGERLWSLSIAVNPGNSGGPVVDATSGEVVGVVSQMMTRTQAQGVAVPHPELVRVLEEAAKSTSSERQRADSLHRQRWCYRQIADRIDDAQFVLRNAREAAVTGNDRTPAERLSAFHELKRGLVERFDEAASSSDPLVTQELARLASDPHCDQQAERGLARLASARDALLAEVRRTVPPDRLSTYLDAVDAAFLAARRNADALGERLQIEFDWSGPP